MSTEAKPASSQRDQLLQASRQIDTILADKFQLLDTAKGEMERSFILATMVIDTQQEIKKLLPILKQLQGSALGFRTDLDHKNERYPDDVVLRVATEAILRRLRWTNDEWMIYKGNLHIKANAYARWIREFPGVTDLDWEVAMPKVENGKISCACEARWYYFGEERTLKTVIPIRGAGSGQSEAQMRGVAKSGLLKSVYENLTASQRLVAVAALEDGAAPARPGITVRNAPVGAISNVQPDNPEADALGVGEAEEEPAVTEENSAEPDDGLPGELFGEPNGGGGNQDTSSLRR